MSRALEVPRFVGAAGGIGPRLLVKSFLPDLGVIGRMASPHECEQLIALGKGSLQPSTVIQREDGRAVTSDQRATHDTTLPRGTDPLVTAVETRISDAFTWPIADTTELQLVRYLPGASFQNHYDFHPPAYLVESGRRQRVASLIIYLNDVWEGGETAFDDAGLAVFPAQGNALFFSYRVPRRASMTCHAGRPPTSGEKWIAVKWFLA